MKKDEKKMRKELIPIQSKAFGTQSGSFGFTMISIRDHYHHVNKLPVSPWLTVISLVISRIFKMI